MSRLLLNLWKKFWPNTGFLVGSFSSLALCKYSPLLSGLQSFWWDFCFYLIENPLWLISHSSFAIFKIHSVCLWTVWLCVSVWVSLVYPTWSLLNLFIFTSFIKFGMSSGIISSNNLSAPSSLFLLFLELSVCDFPDRDLDSDSLGSIHFFSFFLSGPQTRF